MWPSPAVLQCVTRAVGNMDRFAFKLVCSSLLVVISILKSNEFIQIFHVGTGSLKLSVTFLLKYWFI